MNRLEFRAPLGRAHHSLGRHWRLLGWPWPCSSHLAGGPQVAGLIKTNSPGLGDKCNALGKKDTSRGGEFKCKRRWWGRLSCLMAPTPPTRPGQGRRQANSSGAIFHCELEGLRPVGWLPGRLPDWLDGRPGGPERETPSGPVKLARNLALSLR